MSLKSLRKPALHIERVHGKHKVLLFYLSLVPDNHMAIIPTVEHIHRLHYTETTSTNDRAKEALTHFSSSGESAIVAVTADWQIAGRGRLGREWKAQPNANLALSIGIRYGTHRMSMNALPALQGLGALAALYAIRSVRHDLRHAPCRFFLKYPNDVYAEIAHGVSRIYRKCSGVVVENDFSGAECIQSVIGIGINVLHQSFPEELQLKAITLEECGCAITPRLLAERVLQEFRVLAGLDSALLMRAWEEELRAFPPQFSVVGKNGVWCVERLEDDARLLIRRTDTHDAIVREYISSGDSLILVHE